MDGFFGVGGCGRGSSSSDARRAWGRWTVELAAGIIEILAFFLCSASRGDCDDAQEEIPLEIAFFAREIYASFELFFEGIVCLVVSLMDGFFGVGGRGSSSSAARRACGRWTVELAAGIIEVTISPFGIITSRAVMVESLVVSREGQDRLSRVSIFLDAIGFVDLKRSRSIDSTQLDRVGVGSLVALRKLRSVS
ncbi:hypothetical protein DY000_02037504 [Brassica cretica]|uniref:Uncharacterized protein n=1 Tax=Brassica cretica TaxID=69181 RepID=A0ABQ7B529_BRACR|nr:hypothetical protein DY000_02037504 [Brassica cretica]